ncbi:NRDE family protein [Pseudomonas sp. 2FG]|uniref:NRDE family protein n=1 Tax=Pseudomonas sp. 2FG TaxID=2502191 RepID=UPI0010F51F32|nr:NRDE family protein [Pseudomonas sp. 2FG]
MCLIVFAWRPGHAIPLVLAANRDEFYARPSLPLGAWEDAPGVIAGRDLEAGGTWLGIGPQGRFAALTNIRVARQPQIGRSRGELVAQFLRGPQSPEAFLAELAQRASDYAGFNLLVGSTHELWHFNSHEGAPLRLGSGIYGLSNANLNTPWPKVRRAKAALAECLDPPQAPTLLGILGDPQQAPEASLPDTGLGLATERLLSSIFIAGPNYGTRASSALIVQADGRRQLVERSFGPYGAHLGEVSLEC